MTRGKSINTELVRLKSTQQALDALLPRRLSADVTKDEYVRIMRIRSLFYRGVSTSENDLLFLNEIYRRVYKIPGTVRVPKGKINYAKSTYVYDQICRQALW